jgi:hypothetical protein
MKMMNKPSRSSTRSVTLHLSTIQVLTVRPMSMVTTRWLRTGKSTMVETSSRSSWLQSHSSLLMPLHSVCFVPIRTLKVSSSSSKKVYNSLMFQRPASSKTLSQSPEQHPWIETLRYGLWSHQPFKRVLKQRVLKRQLIWDSLVWIAWQSRSTTLGLWLAHTTTTELSQSIMCLLI